MAGETLGEVIRRLSRSGGLQGDLTQTDAQLLDRFARRRDEPAFAALMARHGPMVLGLCRRLLRDPRDAEDAFQAAFLVLARKAGAVQRQTLLSSWLYGVAWRVALPLRGQAARRREREQSGVDLDALPADDAAWSDVRWVVHEEVQRLPHAYRSAVVLCCLEGKTNEEAARLLRRPVGTVKSRLTRARELLRTRLTRRGLAVCAGAVGAALAAAPATASAALAKATLRAALPFAAGGAAAGGTVSARAVTLSQGVLRTMFFKKATIATVLVLTLALVGGAGGLAYHCWAGQPGDGPAAAKAADKAPPSDQPKDDKAKDDKEALQGVWRVVAVETEGVERDDQVARDVKKQTWTMRGDKLVVHIEAPSPARDAKFTYSLDPTQTPKAFDLTSEQAAEGSPLKNLHGVYSVDGDVLKFCYAMTGAEVEWWYQNVGKRREGFKELNVLLPAGPRPKEVATKEGSKTTLLTLKREPAEKQKPAGDKPEEDKPVDKPKEDKEALRGTWQVVSIEVGGKEATGGRAEQEKKAQWVVKDHVIALQSKDPSYVALSELFAVRPGQNPKEIDINPYPIGAFAETDVVKGIYTLDGDVWKVCLGKWPMDPEDAPRPKEMATKEGGKAVLITLKRVVDGKEGGKENQPRPSDPTMPPTGKASEKEQKLLQDWCDAAKTSFELRKGYFVFGRTDIEPCIGASKRLLAAELARSATKEDRLAVYQAHLDRVTDIEKIAKAKVEAGKLAEADAADAEYYRLEAEILLERENAK